MAEKDFADFINDVPNNKTMLDEFIKLINKKPGSTKEIQSTTAELMEFFHNNGYKGVTARDCETIVSTAEALEYTNIEIPNQVKY